MSRLTPNQRWINDIRKTAKRVSITNEDVVDDVILFIVVGSEWIDGSRYYNKNDKEGQSMWTKEVMRLLNNLHYPYTHCYDEYSHFFKK